MLPSLILYLAAGEQSVKAMQAFAFEAYPAALVPRLSTMDSMQAFLHVEVTVPKASPPPHHSSSHSALKMLLP